MLMILTSVIGMLLAVPGMVPLGVLIIGNLGIALCAGSAAAVNHLVDRQVDKQMTRTINRPVATGRVDPWHEGLIERMVGRSGVRVLGRCIHSLTEGLTVSTQL